MGFSVFCTQIRKRIKRFVFHSFAIQFKALKVIHIRVLKAFKSKFMSLTKTKKLIQFTNFLYYENLKFQLTLTLLKFFFNYSIGTKYLNLNVIEI